LHWTHAALSRTADPPQPVTHDDADAQRTAKQDQRQLVWQAEQHAHMEIDAPAG